MRAKSKTTRSAARPGRICPRSGRPRRAAGIPVILWIASSRVSTFSFTTNRSRMPGNSPYVQGWYGAVDEVRSPFGATQRSEEHTSELQSRLHLVCRLLLEKKKNTGEHANHRTAIAACPSLRHCRTPLQH